MRAGADRTSRLDADDRHRHILALLEEDGRVEVADLAVRLGASEETIRRDLRRLERDALLIRAHGGAVRPPAAGAPDGTHGERALLERVARELPSSGAVYLDGGRLAEQLVPLLPEDGDIDLITPLLDVAIAASVRPGVRVLDTGGQVDAAGAQSGDWARETIAGLRFDVAVLFSDGCSAEGELIARPADANLRALALSRARRTVLALGESEGSASHFAVYAGVVDFDIVIACAEIAGRHAGALSTVDPVIVGGGS